MSLYRVSVDHNENNREDTSDDTSNSIESSSSDHQDSIRLAGPFTPIKKDRLGRYRSCLCGRIVVGPQLIRLFMSLCYFALLAGCLWFKRNLIIEDLHWIVLWVAIFLVGISCLAFIQLATTDPGVLPKDYNLANWSQEYQLHKHLPDPRMRYCGICKAIRPPRSFHCIFCNICIRQQDLHFFMSGSCIGQLNVRKYISLVNLLNVMAFFMTTVDILIICFHFEKKSFDRVDYLATWISLFICISLQILPQTGVLMFCYRLYLVKSNRTFREEYSSMMSKKKLNIPESRSFFINFCHIIGPPKHFSFFKQKPNQIRDEQLVNRGLGQSYKIVREDYHCEESLNKNQNLNLSNDERPVLKRQKDLKIDQNNNKMEFVSLDRIKAWRRYESKVEKVKPFNSLTILDSGALKKVHASGRFIRSKRENVRKIVAQEIQRFQEISKIPLCDQPRPRPCLDSLSDSCIPRSSNDKFLIQISRASKFEKIIKLLMARNMDELRRFAQRVNIGALIGVRNMDLDNLQLVDLGGLPIFGLPPGFVVDENQPEQNQVGVSQLTSAGLIPTLSTMRAAVDREAEQTMRQVYTRARPNNHYANLGIQRDINRSRIRSRQRLQSRLQDF